MYVYPKTCIQYIHRVWNRCAESDSILEGDGERGLLEASGLCLHEAEQMHEFTLGAVRLAILHTAP